MPEVFPGASTLVQGSFRGSLILIGPPGTGKSIFCKQFLGNAAERGSLAVYASTEESVDKVRDDLALLGFDVAQRQRTGFLKIVALRSIISGTEAHKREIGISGWIKGHQKEETLAGVRRALEASIIGVDRPTLVVDSLSTMFLERDETPVLKLVQDLLATLKSLDALSLFSLNLGSHDDRTVNVLRSLFDGVLEIKVEEIEGGTERRLRVFSLKGVNHSADWVRFSISDRGVSIEGPLKASCAWCSQPLGHEPLSLEIGGEVMYFDRRECLVTYRKLKSVHGDVFR